MRSYYESYPVRLAFLLTAVSIWPIQAWGDNGAVATAVPLGTIVVDGDLCDWPNQIQQHPISQILFGQSSGSPTDISATFCIGFRETENAFYCGVTVTDDSYVGVGDRWFDQDVCRIFLDQDHFPSGSAPIVFMAGQTLRSNGSTKNSWDPKVKDGNWNSTEVAVHKSGNRVVYEWRFELTDNATIERSIGFDIEILDVDKGSGNNVTIGWGPFAGKELRSARCGDVLFQRQAVKVGRLTGKVRWRNGVNGPEMIRPRVRITSQSNPNFWAQIVGDKTGAL